MAETKKMLKSTKERINKKVLIKQVKVNLSKVHNIHDISLTAIGSVLEAVTESMLSYVKQGKEVFWSGFGVLMTQKRKQTVRRNPQNGQEIKIPAKEVVKMKLFKSFGEKVLAKSPKKSKK